MIRKGAHEGADTPILHQVTQLEWEYIAVVSCPDHGQAMDPAVMQLSYYNKGLLIQGKALLVAKITKMQSIN